MDAAQHHRRLQNLRDASETVKSCVRMHAISDYLPVQVTSPWTWQNRESGPSGPVLTIAPRDLLFLRRAEGLL